MSENFGSEPYADYRVYKIFHKEQKRYYAMLYKPDHQTTIAWAKYILEVSLGRKLKPEYEAHHKDGDRLNDEPSNLEECHKDSHKKHHGELRRQQRVIRHGTLTESKFCKCEECRGAKRAYNRKYSGSPVQGTQPPEPRPIRHGSAVAYSYHRCRCRQCKDGAAARMRDYLAIKRMAR